MALGPGHRVLCACGVWVSMAVPWLAPVACSRPCSHPRWGASDTGVPAWITFRGHDCTRHLTSVLMSLTASLRLSPAQAGRLRPHPPGWLWAE